jgi:hypothetical protein
VTVSSWGEAPAAERAKAASADGSASHAAARNPRVRAGEGRAEGYSVEVEDGRSAGAVLRVDVSTDSACQREEGEGVKEGRTGHFHNRGGG